MRNFKVTIDLSDFHSDLHLKKFMLREYSTPFTLIFIEAEDPDEACHYALFRLIRLLLDQDPSIMTRLLCRKIKRQFRIDKIASL